jgi:transketolase
VLNVLAQNIPWFLGGSADLGPSNKTQLTFEGAGQFQPASLGGKNLHYGIREHAMGAVVNGMSLSKLRPFGATFFIFSDYVPSSDPALGFDGITHAVCVHSRCHGRW